MSRLLSTRSKSSFKETNKPLPSVKEPKNDATVEFRWSTTVIQYGLSDDPYMLNFAADEAESASRYAARNATKRPAVHSNRKHSIHLPPLHTSKKATVRSSSNENSPQYLPLLVPYSHLNHLHKPLPAKTKTQTPQRSRQSVLHSDLSLSSTSTSSSSDKYVRLPLPQLRRLHVSNKYLQEARNLYFNPVSRVFVPRRPLVQIGD